MESINARVNELANGIGILFLTVEFSNEMDFAHFNFSYLIYSKTDFHGDQFMNELFKYTWKVR